MSKKNLMDLVEIDFAKNSLFFGNKNIMRLELETDVDIEKKRAALRNALWFSSDFSLVNDAVAFSLMPPEKKNMFLKNLKFQQFADSLAARTISTVFMPVTSDPLLEAYWVECSFSESVHVASYADIIKALPVDAKKEFDEIIIDKNIIKRGEEIVKRFEDLLNNQNEETLLMALYALSVLEGCLFQSSFITSFSFAESYGMTEIGKVIQKIQADENIHFSMDAYLIKSLLKDKRYQKIQEENKSFINDMFATAMKIDYDWIDYVVTEPTPTINNESMKQYVRYNTKKSMDILGLDSSFISQTDNPFDWSKKYLNTKGLQTSLNETSGTSYMIGIVKDNLNTIEEKQEIWKIQ